MVQQTENAETGFSATLFQEINEDGTLGEYHLATRGSADMINFYLHLTHSGDVSQFQFTLVEDINLEEEQVTLSLENLAANDLSQTIVDNVDLADNNPLHLSAMAA